MYKNFKGLVLAVEPPGKITLLSPPAPFPPLGLKQKLTFRYLSLLLRRFVFRMAERASAKRVTGDEPQGTMGHQKRDVWVRGSRYL